jgi:hypothetical protein
LIQLSSRENYQTKKTGLDAFIFHDYIDTQNGENTHHRDHGSHEDV